MQLSRLRANFGVLPSPPPDRKVHLRGSGSTWHICSSPSMTRRRPRAIRRRKSVFALMPNNVSIVSSSILSALAGEYGDVHATGRTQGSQLWINPLMAAYWCFRLDRVAERILYRKRCSRPTPTSTSIRPPPTFDVPARRFGRRSPFPYDGMPRRPTGLDEDQ
jgi:hypothetical protein